MVQRDKRLENIAQVYDRIEWKHGRARILCMDDPCLWCGMVSPTMPLSRMGGVVVSVLTKVAAEIYNRTAFASFEARKDFTLANAKALMWLSQLAYETDEPGKVTTLLGAWGLRLLHDGIISAPATAPLPMARTEALVVERDNAAFVAFAGTDPLVLADWVADFDIRPHLGTTEGFSLALRDAMPHIQNVLKQVRKPVFVTGHSLGGALAALAAQNLATSGAAVMAVYTYGMPRPGSARFGVAYDAKLGATTYRLVHGEDIVPTVAPSFLGFRHVGRLLYCESGVHFETRNLTAVGSDEPQFFNGTAKSLLDRVQKTFDALTTPNASAAHRHTGPSWVGRPDFVKALIRAQSQRIQDHLPDSYIKVLR
jgi:triacylglycerol lipase